MLRRSPSLTPVALVCLLPMIGSCRPSGRVERFDVEPQDPRWGAQISDHTSGTISKRDRIRVVFAEDVVEQGRVGQSAATVLSLEPALEGSVTFASTREILVVPARDLPAGRQYRVTLVREQLMGIPRDLERYEFLVEVMNQDFEVGVTGLSPDPGNASGLVLSGTLVTADVDEADAIEGMVTAAYQRADLDVGWQHDMDGRHHEFTVSGITRGARNETLRLTWDGEAIGVDAQGEREITVPGRDMFLVTRIDALQDDRQYVLVHFSDELDPRQNLNGLVGIGGGTFRTAVGGNTVQIFPDQRLTGPVSVSLEPGIRSSGGKRLADRIEQTVTFAEDKPGVRFAGRGVVLPENDVLTVPIEAINVHSVQLTALRVYETNVGQFLQTNALGGNSQLDRTGRTLWRRTIALPTLGVDQWNRFTLDVTDLVRAYPGGLVRLTVSINRGNSTYTCTEEENQVPVVKESDPVDRNHYEAVSASGWDGIQDYYQSTQLRWSDREDPCKDAYFRWSDQVSDARNFLASNIGMTAKRDLQGNILVATTDLRTSESLEGVSVTFMNFQNQPMGSVTTGSDGLARTSLEGTPFYALADHGNEKGYLKMSPGTALPTSHFDVGGEAVSSGLKGMIYGERGVWRPGDDIHLTFVLQDEGNPVPDGHPATLRLFNPMGQPVRTTTNATPTNGFYTFALSTAEDAPTGNWNATVDLGGARFSTILKVETVMPNRLRVELDLGEDDVLRRGRPIEATLFGQWLNGAIARDLKADVEVVLAPTTTAFDRFSDFVFDDPAREYGGEPQRIFEGVLDAEGRAAFQAPLAPGRDSPGMLTARFATRIFERGGAFSTNRMSTRYSPYDRYVGVKLPAGDAVRGMLLTDTTHTVQIASLTAGGDPVSVDSVEVTLYKIEWKWWWDRSGESLAQYASSQHRSVVAQGGARTVDGRGTWDFQIDYPAWGRYLIRACDAGGGHCTGKTFYVDWPGWAGRAQEQSGPSAAVLTVRSDKDAYTVGEIAEIQLPEASQGRALVTLETGTRLLEERWVELREGRARFEVPITRDMSPNVYVWVSLIQPHADRVNDLPIRLYGVVPLEVTDPASRLQPVVGVPEEWRPDSEVAVEVSEASGRHMTYTLAVVDEGLLGLTSFATPDLHQHFFRKEALGVTTWDLFDEVVGAYGGELERLLALGGSGSAELGETEQSRFPPVVRFYGPFTLASGGRATHAVDLPQYIGQVRVMVVAGDDGAYGSASASVFVREPLSMLATVPRVVGPGEEITVPVSLFAMQEGIDEATLTVQTDDRFDVVGSTTATVTFDGPEEKVAFLRLRVGPTPGPGTLRFTATAGEHTTRSEIALEVRSPNPLTVKQLRAEIAPGETWSTDVIPHGIPGTNAAMLEVTTLPPLNLEPRLRYLVRYPHGCVEQVTSAVFPQLYLPGLVALEPAAREEIEKNIRAGIDRLRGFQLPSGAFAYWMGGFTSAAFDARSSWATNYVGHFLVEAERLGYYVPAEMMSDWVNHQKRMAQSWTRDGDSPAMDQAYRLYTLALSGRPEMGAMNRLRASGALDAVATWHLAAAYQLAGVPEVANGLLRIVQTIPTYERAGWSLGSSLRDRGILLNTLVTVDQRAEAARVAGEISDALFSDTWHSTHAVSYALLAMARFYGVGDAGDDFSFERRAGESVQAVTPSSPIHSEALTGIGDRATPVSVRNTSDRPLFASLVVQGVPAAGDEVAASSGLEIHVAYADASGRPLDPSRLSQGMDFVARVTVTNRTRIDLENLALEHRVPSGWEIHNPRMDGDESGAPSGIEYQDLRDDRILTYFPLDAGKSITFTSLFNAAYLGTYYLPSVSVEAMYDASKHARTAGQWVRVTEERR